MTSATELLASCRRHHAWLVSTIEDLVRLESPSDDAAALRHAAAAIAARMEGLGWRVARIPQADDGTHLRAAFGSGGERVLLLGHYDTVWPVGQLGHMPVRREAGRLHGPGVYDMKSGIAIAWLAMRVLADAGVQLPFEVVMLLTSDEETGSATSRRLIEDEADHSLAVLVLEPSLANGGVKTARKGVGEYRIEVRGRSAHAGIEPERGASAIVEISRIVLALGELQDLDRGVTITVGRIEGGTRTNVVPDRAVAEVDVRIPTRGDAERVDVAIRGLTPRTPGVTLHVSGGVNRPPLERTAGVAALYAHARAVAQSLGDDLPEGATGGGSDGNFTAARGVPTLDGLGPRGAGAHALDEHVLIDGLASRAALLAGLLVRLASSRAATVR